MSKHEILAVVNGDSIRTSDIEAIFGNIHGSMSAQRKSEFDYRSLLTKLINDRLLVQEAEAMGIPNEEFFIDFMTEQEEKLVSRKYVSENFQKPQNVSESEVLEYFNENYRKYRVRTLSVETIETADSLREVIASGVPMDSLARLHSLDVFRYQGGLHSFKYWADIEPELRAQLSGISEGEFIGPFPYRKVFALMKVEEIVPADQSELPKYREYIEEITKATNTRQAWVDFISSIRSRYQVLVDSSLINEIASSTNSVLDSTFLSGADRALVKSNSGSISVNENTLRKETAHSAMTKATLPIGTLLYQTLNDIIERQVLQLAGFDAQFDTLATIQNRLSEIRDSVLIEVYLKEFVVSRVKFNHQEFQSFYDSHLDRFREPDELKLRQVQISTQTSADSAVGLLQDGADFDYIADKFRQGSKELSEKTEWVKLSSFPESVRRQMEKLIPGQSSSALATSDGWVIFKVLDRKQGRQKTLEEVDMQIREAMFQEKFSALLDGALAEIREHSEIIYFDEAIENYFGADN